MVAPCNNDWTNLCAGQALTRARDCKQENEDDTCERGLHNVETRERRDRIGAARAVESRLSGKSKRGI
jgi:hypothetical protein